MKSKGGETCYLSHDFFLCTSFIRGHAVKDIFKLTLYILLYWKFSSNAISNFFNCLKNMFYCFLSKSWSKGITMGWTWWWLTSLLLWYSKAPALLLYLWHQVIEKYLQASYPKKNIQPSGLVWLFLYSLSQFNPVAPVVSTHWQLDLKAW